MDQVLEQVISAIEPMDLAKTAECYQRLASLTIRQDSKLSYLAGRIAGVGDAASGKIAESRRRLCS